MAGSYDELEPWYEHLYAVLDAILIAALAPERPGRALDAGCGSGFQARRLAALGWQTHGVDIAGGLLAQARRCGAAAVRATIETLPYADGTFDVATCCGSTLSFVEAPARALAEIGRVLRPGGRLLLECEHRFSLDLAWALVDRLAAGRLGYRQTLRGALGHLVRSPRHGVVIDYPGYGTLRLFTLPELRSMLAGAGLWVERVWGIHAATNLIPSTVLHRARLSRPLGALYRGLCAADDLLRRTRLAHLAANSAVVLARKGPAPRRPAPAPVEGR